MIKLAVHLFATLRDRAGQDSVQISVAEPATVQDLLNALETNYPALAPSLPTTIVAVNKEFAFATTSISAQDEIALFPPVSGGDHDTPHPTYFAITEEELDAVAIQERLAQPDVGAIATFTGFVRGKTRRENLPEQTTYLEYEAYNDMAQQKMSQIAREIWQRWPEVKGVAIVQRIGRLEVGSITTFVACASGHRDQGIFDAARYGIDRLKEIVPVWKKEIGPENSQWVEGHYQPQRADNSSF